MFEAQDPRQPHGVLPRCVQDFKSTELLQQQACYLPCSPDGLPLIGRVPGLENAYVATGKRILLRCTRGRSSRSLAAHQIPAPAAADPCSPQLLGDTQRAGHGPGALRAHPRRRGGQRELEAV